MSQTGSRAANTLSINGSVFFYLVLLKFFPFNKEYYLFKYNPQIT